MTALAEALVAAQRRAVQVLEKAYVAGSVDSDELVAQLGLIGLTDAVDTAALIHALDVLREHGGALPAAGNGAAVKPPELASDAQVKLIQSLLARKQLAPLAEADLRRLEKPKASELIDQLQAGTYSSAAWDVPFE